MLATLLCVGVGLGACDADTEQAVAAGATDASLPPGEADASTEMDSAVSADGAAQDDSGTGANGTMLRVMTFNMLFTSAPADAARVIEAAQADVVVVQEAVLAAGSLGDALGLEPVALGGGLRPVNVYSRFDVLRTAGHGVRLRLCTDVEVAVFGVHLEPFPYQPYDLRDDPSLTEQALVEAARATRGAEVTEVLGEIDDEPDAAAVFLAGDFNEPSHLDWTAEAAAMGLHLSRAVAWPSSLEVVAAGLVDSYRAQHPDPVDVPGDTWTPMAGEDEVHDRIDFVYHSQGVQVMSAQVVGEAEDTSDIVVGSYPSDHRAVVVTYQLPGPVCP